MAEHIRAPPITAMGAAKGILSGIKSKIPKNLPTGPSEKLQFAKHARGRDGGALSDASATSQAASVPPIFPGDMEMQAVNNVDMSGGYVDPNTTATYPQMSAMGMEGQMTGEGGEMIGADGTVPPGAPGGGPSLKRTTSMWSGSTAGVEGGHDMITEWQAGWNVTNAIQVKVNPDTDAITKK